MMSIQRRFSLNRRQCLQFILAGLSSQAIPALAASAVPAPSFLQKDSRSLLLPPDKNGIRLLDGFRVRIVATSGEVAAKNATYRWHISPDGGAVFPAAENGWYYVSNSEVDDNQGGVGVLRFSAQGEIIDTYAILSGTNRNCAGGATPWGTWLSCEEIDRGAVWETDPGGKQAAIIRPALGRFKHEAVAVDVSRGHCYLTEDEKDGCLYRFASPVKTGGRMDLEHGVLQVAVSDSGKIDWVEVPDASAKKIPTRYQVPNAEKFLGGEGIVLVDNRIYFSTKYDNKIWSLNRDTRLLSILYEAKMLQGDLLTGVDNICAHPSGYLVVAEDGGDMQLVMLSFDGQVQPILQIVGQDQSELTGVAFSIAGDRLYFSSQRALGANGVGITYEVQGDFGRLAEMFGVVSTSFS